MKSSVSRCARRSLLGASAALLTVLTAPVMVAQAQSQPDTVLVLDASNSMWGQIDGVAKIEIAREALGDYVRSIAPDTRLGVFAYGHRQAGRCDDIEQVRALSRVNADQVIAQVNGLTPRGKTPLTDAIRQAAGALGSEGGSIIILTDGVETCGGDACALAAELAASGIDLTAHVVGFDIQTPGDRASLSCIAQQTGGVYLDAANGEELAEALETAARTTPQSVAPRSVALSARLEGSNRSVTQASFFVMDATGAVLLDGGAGPVDLRPGRYRAVALTDQGNGAVEAEVTSDAPDVIIVPIAAEIPEASMTLDGVAQAGRPARFSWEGPDGEDDYLQLALADGAPTEVDYSAWTRDGSPAEIVMPGEPGAYQVQYRSASLNQVLGSTVFNVEPSLATIDAPDSVAVGGVIEVRWTGPDEEGDWIGFVPVGGVAGQLAGYSYARTEDSDGDTLSIPVPGQEGPMELIYVLESDNTVLARRTVMIEDVEALIEAPSEAMGGGAITVAINAPSMERDWVGIVEVGAGASVYVRNAWASVDGASSMSLRVPGAPGDYEVRYIREAADGATILASLPLSVVDGGVTIEAPASVAAGESFTVTTTGPGLESDYIDFARPDTALGDYSLGWGSVSEDGSASLTAPDEPGQYRLRYIITIGAYHVLAESRIEVR
ncbi:VWA domain-containing protein [Oceanicaulis sp. LC35]|uniref:vWA domain-containing protein n=1 Tax=Oceanicaulis sp. LC35 TaxID=3349635 RepID=UPI003F87EB3D